MAIVYRQEELIKALDEGIKEITLCAGIFNVRNASSVVFDRIGPVKVFVDYTFAQAEKLGLRFVDIYPTYKVAYAIETREEMLPVAAGSSYGSAGSYLSSYGSYMTSGVAYSSYGSLGGSSTGTYYYEYEYEYGTSWKTSATGSYAMGYSFSETYRTSYAGSLSVGYENSFSTSVASSFSDSFSNSFKNTMSFSETKPDTIRVFGYGINLI